MRVKFYLFLLVSLFSTVTSFSQVLDQNHINFSSGSVNSAVTFGQSFTAGLSGRFSQFDFPYWDGGAYNYKCELKIYSGTGITGTLLKTQPFVISQSVPSGIAQVTINNGPVVVAGSVYSAVITVLSGPPDGKMRYRYITNYPNYQDGTPTDSYPGGALLFNTGTYSQDMGFKTYVTEAPATHLNFDGVNDYITLSNENSFDFTNQMTVEFWMNSNTTPAQWDALVTKGDDSWRIALTGDGKVNFACGGTSFGSVTSNASVIDGNWHHLAFTFNGATAIIYIDGVQDASISGTGSMNNSAYQVAIGENLQATGRYYTGSMDEVRIWNIARSASEISGAKNCELSGSESGLLAYYKFNQGMGYVNNTSITSLIDASSNNNNGTFNGFALNGITSNFVTSEGFNAPSLPTLSAPVIFSQTNPASLVSASIGSLLWYTTATGGTSSTTPPTLTFSGNGSASYWISAINSRGCETDRVELVVVNAASIPNTPTALPIQLYKGDGTLANLTATGTNLEWFSTSIGGTALAISTVLVDNTTYYVSQSPLGVRSARISVKAKKISTSTQVFCSNTAVADLISTPSTGAAVKWFSNTTDSTPLTNSDAVSTGSLYVEQSIASATTSIGSGFLKPQGIFVDASGNVYVADTDNNAVKKMDSNGTTVQTIGSGFYRPLDVTVDVLGNIYVFDSNLKGIVKMDSQGNNKALIYEFGGGPIVFNPGPPRLFTDRLGNIYLYHNYSIKKMDSNGGNVQEIFTTINGKTAMALDQLGNFYIVSGIELQKIDAVTGAVSILGSDFSSFYGIKNLVVDQLGTIYYTRNYNLTKINNDGTNIQVVASGVGNESGLSIDEFGSIYMATYNNTESDVKKINPNFTSNRVAIAMTVETLTVPTFTAPVFIQGATATGLTATSTGTGLLWYTVATGGTGSTTAPIPSTDTLGSTSYWVSSTSNAGCESARAQMVVTVTLPATHLSFDGVNDFVNIGSVISAGSSYTKEAMIKANAITGTYNIISSAGDVFWIYDNYIRAGHTSNFSHVFAPAALLLNSWNHVAVTYDAPTTTMKLYINGALVSTNTNVQATAGNVMQIGAYSSLVPFNGSMDDVRIWNVARTQAQITASKNCELQGNESGLLAYYNFNQGTGSVSNTSVTSLINSVSGGSNGTLQNFALAGVSSNWLAGSPIITGVMIPSLPTADAQSFCGSKTVADLVPASSATIKWFTVATGGTELVSTTALATGTYYVSQSNSNGCESARNLVEVTVSLAKIWTGTSSTDWHTAANWCDNSVPTASSTVVISNTVNKPLITENTQILSLEIQAGAKLNIANTLTITQNIINEGQLIFKSDATSTGQFGVFNGTISGNGTAVVERYIPAKRAWRALTAPLKGTNGSLYANWQNNGVVIPNVGAEIWGPSGTGLATGEGYSVLEYTSTGYVDVTNTQTKNLFDTNKNNAYLMFVIGGYGSGNIANTEVAQPTTLSATGKLITGNVINSNINGVRHNLIGNPYASALNPATLLDNTTNLIQKFWVWDPHSGTSGGYVMYDKVAGTYNNTTGSYPTGTTAVQSGQGFFVKATTGNTGSITLTENNKSSAVTNAVFSTNIPEIFRLGMYRQQAQNWLPLDGAIAVMYPSANPEVDANDGRKFVNSSENIAFRRSNTSLSSEHHLPIVANDTLYIKVWNTTPNVYKLRLNTEKFTTTGLTATLQDLYTNENTVLNLDGATNEYLFNVTTDAASTNERFRIVFQTEGNLSTTNPTKNPFIIAPNPVTNQIVTIYFKDNQTQKLKYTLVNALGQLIAQGNVNADNTINVATVATGMYVLQLQTENNEVYTSKLIIK